MKTTLILAIPFSILLLTEQVGTAQLFDDSYYLTNKSDTYIELNVSEGGYAIDVSIYNLQTKELLTTGSGEMTGESKKNPGAMSYTFRTEYCIYYFEHTEGAEDQVIQIKLIDCKNPAADTKDLYEMYFTEKDPEIISAGPEIDFEYIKNYDFAGFNGEFQGHCYQTKDAENTEVGSMEMDGDYFFFYIMPVGDGFIAKLDDPKGGEYTCIYSESVLDGKKIIVKTWKANYEDESVVEEEKTMTVVYDEYILFDDWIRCNISDCGSEE